MLISLYLNQFEQLVISNMLANSLKKRHIYDIADLMFYLKVMVIEAFAIFINKSFKFVNKKLELDNTYIFAVYTLQFTYNTMFFEG